MVDIASAVPGVVGRRSPGPGLGGCIMVLVQDEASTRYGASGRPILPSPRLGTGRHPLHHRRGRGPGGIQLSAFSRYRPCGADRSQFQRNQRRPARRSRTPQATIQHSCGPSDSRLAPSSITPRRAWISGVSGRKYEQRAGRLRGIARSRRRCPSRSTSAASRRSSARRRFRSSAPGWPPAGRCRRTAATPSTINSADRQVAARARDAEDRVREEHEQERPRAA